MVTANMSPRRLPKEKCDGVTDESFDSFLGQRSPGRKEGKVEEDGGYHLERQPERAYQHKHTHTHTGLIKTFHFDKDSSAHNGTCGSHAEIQEGNTNTASMKQAGQF